MYKKNTKTLELIHAWSKQQKSDYNKEYYQLHKDRWKKYKSDSTSAWLRNLDDRYKDTFDREKKYKDALQNLVGPRDPKTSYELYQKSLEVEKAEAARRNAVAGDMAMVRGVARAHQKMETQRYPQVMYNFKQQKAIKRKKFVENVKNKTVSAIKNAGSKVVNAGKSFVDNWKRGIEIK